MRSFSKLFLFLLPLAQAFGQDAAGTSTVTFGVGGGTFIQNPYGTNGGPTFTGTYEFRPWKYLSFEAGVGSMQTTSYYTATANSFRIDAGTSLISPSNTFSYISYRGGSRATLVPFGFRGILPLAGGRVELFAGGGGAHTWDTNPRNQAWAVQGNAGVRIAINKQRHFWLGTTGRFFHELTSEPQERVTWTADLGYRF